MKVCQYCGWNDGEHADGCENENAEPLPVRSESSGSVLGITSEKTVWCSRCSKWEQQDANQFQKSIKAWGWTSVKRKWLCPDCSKQND